MSESIIKFWQDEEAATAVEYGLIAALIGAAIAGAVTTLGTNLSGLFTFIAGKFTTRT
ncbi:MAG: Flp family type IVb pilin [Cytophagaceae bacterium]|nr:MAG: Flp family type IVb pilin [Cytophagaceae bacterium]